MPDRAEEQAIAELVEGVWRSRLNIDPGPTRLYEPPGCGIDFIYPNASRPAALEVTSLVRSEHNARHQAARRHLRSLDEIAKNERLGSWVLWIGPGVHVKSIEAEAAQILRSRRSGPKRRASMWKLDRVRSDHHGVSVASTSTITRGGGDPSTTSRLATEIVRNMDKLAAAKPRYETHLAVSARRGFLEPDLHSVLVPGGAGEFGALDWLWVIAWDAYPDEPRIWWARPGSHGWSTDPRLR